MCSSTWGTCSPTFFSDLGVCRIISYAFFFPHFAPLSGVLLFIKYALPRAPPAWLMGSALSSGWSVTDAAGNSCVQHGAAPGLFTEATLASPFLLSKPWDLHLIHTNTGRMPLYLLFKQCTNALSKKPKT